MENRLGNRLQPGNRPRHCNCISGSRRQCGSEFCEPRSDLLGIFPGLTISNGTGRSSKRVRDQLGIRNGQMCSKGLSVSFSGSSSRRRHPGPQSIDCPQSPSAFVQTRLEKKKDPEISVNLYSHYQEWCHENNVRPFASRAFTPDH